MTTNTRHTSYTWRNNLSLIHSFGKHEVSGSIGQEVRSSKYDGLQSTQYGYLPERGKRFVDIDPTLWKRYGTLLKNHPDVVTDTKSNVLSFYATAAYVVISSISIYEQTVQTNSAKIKVYVSYRYGQYQGVGTSSTKNS